jgi:hypothetical protein
VADFLQMASRLTVSVLVSAPKLAKKWSKKGPKTTKNSPIRDPPDLKIRPRTSDRESRDPNDTFCDPRPGNRPFSTWFWTRFTQPELRISPKTPLLLRFSDRLRSASRPNLLKKSVKMAKADPKIHPVFTTPRSEIPYMSLLGFRILATSRSPT